MPIRTEVYPAVTLLKMTVLPGCSQFVPEGEANRVTGRF